MVCIPVGLLPAFTTQGIDMHYYKRNLGDYAKKAGRLTLLQHGSYTVLMDSCYDREQFPTLEQAIEWTWADSVEEIEAVKFVLRKFFILEDGIYVQNRIREEIAEYHEKANTNKRIAIDRETKRKENSTNRVRTVNESSPNQEPVTKNQEPRTSNQEPKESNSKEPKSKTMRETRLIIPPVQVPDWMPVDAWNDFVESRRKIRKPMTQNAIKLAISTLSKLKSEGNNVQEVIEQSILCGYSGLFPVSKGKKQSVTDQNRSAVEEIKLRLRQQDQQGETYEHA
jgi:uncharacterized protein YdaU (DUF1376 family)